jgi:hypothetical protein
MTKEQFLKLKPGSILRVLTDKHHPKMYFAKGKLVKVKRIEKSSFDIGPERIIFDTPDYKERYASDFKDFEVLDSKLSKLLYE